MRTARASVTAASTANGPPWPPTSSNFVKCEALALDVGRVAVRISCAHMAESKIRVPFKRENPARPRYLLAQRLNLDGHHYRRSVGGYSAYGKPKIITTFSAPVL